MSDKSVIEKEDSDILSKCKIKVIYGKESLKNIVDEILENVFEKEISKNNI